MWNAGSASTTPHLEWVLLARVVVHNRPQALVLRPPANVTHQPVPVPRCHLNLKVENVGATADREDVSGGGVGIGKAGWQSEQGNSDAAAGSKHPSSGRHN